MEGVRVELVVAAVALVVLVVLAVRFRWLARIGEWWKRARTFFSEVYWEMKKVSFPSREEVMATTAVVIVASVIFSFYLWLADIVILRVYEGIFKVLGS